MLLPGHFGPFLVIYFSFVAYQQLLDDSLSLGNFANEASIFSQKPMQKEKSNDFIT